MEERVERAGRSGALTEEEMRLARVAWKYFENNYQSSTGFVNNVQDYPSTSMWDTASYLGGLVAAFELGIIDRQTFDTRLASLLRTLNQMELFNGELPNKAYNTITAEKVDYTNEPGEIGYSAIDLGRLLVWLKIIQERYPAYSDEVDRFVLRWNFCNLLDEHGSLRGAHVEEGQIQYVQEGRLGYEEYAARGFGLWGFNTRRASLIEPYTLISIYDYKIPFDQRDPRVAGGHNYVVTESYVLDGIEMNWDMPTDSTSSDAVHTDATFADFARRIHDVQAERFRRTGIYTARTEHQLDEAPYWVYDTIYTSGYPWNTITETGTFVPQYAATALKGAVGMWVLWETPYTDTLFNYVKTYYDPDKGFYEGIYEDGRGVINTFTANNNGIILEALLYKVQGKLLRFGQHDSMWERYRKTGFPQVGQCIQERMHKPEKQI